VKLLPAFYLPRTTSSSSGETDLASANLGLRQQDNKQSAVRV